MPKQRITRSEYHQLVGLLTLASRHNRFLREIEEAAAEILGVEKEYGEYYGHVSDEVFDDEPNVNELLANLELEVEEVS